MAVPLLLGLVFGVIGSSIALATVGTLDPAEDSLRGREEFAVSLPLLLGLGGGALVGAGMDGRRLRQVLGLERFDLPGVAAGLVAGLALQGVAIAIDVFILDPLFDLDDGSQLVEAFQGGFEITLLVLLVGFIAPVCEELAHRGVLLPLWARPLGRRWAVVAGAVFFAVVHFSPEQMPSLVLIGLTLGTLRVWRASIQPALVGHMVFNGAGLVLVAIDGWPTP